MNRRGFFNTLVGGVAAAAAVRTWPFRVYSFPTELAYPIVPFPEPGTWLGLSRATYPGRWAVPLQNIVAHYEHEVRVMELIKQQCAIPISTCSYRVPLVLSQVPWFEQPSTREEM